MSNIPPQGPQGPQGGPQDPRDPRNPQDPNQPYDPNQEEWVEEEVYEEKTPITKQPVFWIAIIAAIAALLALGYLLGDNDGDSNDATTSVVAAEETTEVVTPTEEDPAATETATATATQTVTDQQRETIVEEQPAPAPAPAPADSGDGQDDQAQQNDEALGEAERLLADEPYSKQGLFDRLTSQEGGAFPQEAAQHAVDNIGADWNNEALRAAEKIREDNPDATADDIIAQLTDDNEWNFTDEEAQYAADNIG